jgi:hypothetical protein
MTPVILTEVLDGFTQSFQFDANEPEEPSRNSNMT